MVGREEVQLTEDTARDVLYAGDAPLNEASLHQLLSGPVLAICFRLLDTDKHFVCKFHHHHLILPTADRSTLKTTTYSPFDCHLRSNEG